MTMYYGMYSKGLIVFPVKSSFGVELTVSLTLDLTLR